MIPHDAAGVRQEGQSILTDVTASTPSATINIIGSAYPANRDTLFTASSPRELKLRAAWWPSKPRRRVLVVMANTYAERTRAKS